MKTYCKPLKLLSLVLLFSPLVLARGSASGFCQQGNQAVITPGVSASTTRVQRSYPACTVTVYLSGTTTPATIYSDLTGTAKANPFTASATGYWTFFADLPNLDVNLSGAGISPPWTLGSVSVNPLPFVVPGQYGAKGDGATNDTAAIARAINAACASPLGGVLYLPLATYIIAPVVAANPILPSCSNLTITGPGTLKIASASGSYYSIWGQSGTALSNVTLSDITIDENSAANPLVSLADLHLYPRIVLHTGGGGTSNAVQNVHLTNLRCQWALFVKSSNSRIVGNIVDNTGGGSIIADSSLLYMDPGANGGLISGNQVSAAAPNTPMAVSAIETHDNVLIENNTITNFSSGIVPAEGATPVSPAVIGNKIKGALSGIRFFSYVAYGATGCAITGGTAKANSIVINQLSYLGSLDAGNGVTLDSASDSCFQDMAINDNLVTYDLSTGAGDDYNVSDTGIGYVQANAGGGCFRCDFSGNTIINAPVNAVRLSADGSEFKLQNIRATNPGSSLNPGLSSAFRAGIFVSAFSAAAAGQINVSGAAISDTLATCRFGYGVELATLNTSGIIADGVSVSATDAVCASMVKGIAPNTSSQLPYTRAILNLPVAKVLPGVATAAGSAYISLREAITYTWNGTQYTQFVPHPALLSTSNLSGCGTTPAISGSDREGLIQFGSDIGSPATCVLTFTKAFTGQTNASWSFHTSLSSPVMTSFSSSSTTITFFGTNLANNQVSWGYISKDTGLE